ncbi:hypothetical protein ACH4GE_42420, partial [Streptomyces tendae]
MEEVYEGLPSYWSGVLGSGGLSSHADVGPLRVQAGRVAEILLSIVEQGRLPGSLAGLKGGVPEGGDAGPVEERLAVALTGWLDAQKSAEQAGASQEAEEDQGTQDVLVSQEMEDIEEIGEMEEIGEEGQGQGAWPRPGDGAVGPLVLGELPGAGRATVRWLGDVDVRAQQEVAAREVGREGSLTVGLRPGADGHPVWGGRPVAPEAVAEELLRLAAEGVWTSSTVHWATAGGLLSRDYLDEVLRQLWRRGQYALFTYVEAAVYQGDPGEATAILPPIGYPWFGAWLDNWLARTDPHLSLAEMTLRDRRLKRGALDAYRVGRRRPTARTGLRIVEVLFGWERDAQMFAGELATMLDLGPTGRYRHGRRRGQYRYAGWLEGRQNAIVPKPTRGDLAAASELRWSTFGKAYAGERMPSYATRVKIASGLRKLEREALWVEGQSSGERPYLGDTGTDPETGDYLYGGWLDRQLEGIDPRPTYKALRIASGLSVEHKDFFAHVRAGRVLPNEKTRARIWVGLQHLRRGEELRERLGENYYLGPTKKETREEDGQVKYEYGPWLRRWRQQMEPKPMQAVLANMVGLSQRQMQKIEAGEDYPHPHHRIALAEAMQRLERDPELGVRKPVPRMAKGTYLGPEGRKEYGAWLARQLNALVPKPSEDKFASRIPQHRRNFRKVLDGEEHATRDTRVRILAALRSYGPQARERAARDAPPEPPEADAWRQWVRDRLDVVDGTASQLHEAVNQVLVNRGQNPMDKGRYVHVMRVGDSSLPREAERAVIWEVLQTWGLVSAGMRPASASASSVTDVPTEFTDHRQWQQWVKDLLKSVRPRVTHKQLADAAGLKVKRLERLMSKSEHYAPKDKEPEQILAGLRTLGLLAPESVVPDEAVQAPEGAQTAGSSGAVETRSDAMDVDSVGSGVVTVDPVVAGPWEDSEFEPDLDPALDGDPLSQWGQQEDASWAVQDEEMQTFSLAAGLAHMPLGLMEVLAAGEEEAVEDAPEEDDWEARFGDLIDLDGYADADSMEVDAGGEAETEGLEALEAPEADFEEAWQQVFSFLASHPNPFAANQDEGVERESVRSDESDSEPEGFPDSQMPDAPPSPGVDGIVLPGRTAGPRGGSADSGVDPFGAGWPIGRGVVVEGLGSDGGLDERPLEVLVADLRPGVRAAAEGGTAEGRGKGKGPATELVFERVTPDGSRLGAYRVTAAGEVVLPSGVVLSSEGWVRLGDRFVHVSADGIDGLLYGGGEGSGGWLGEVANADTLARHPDFPAAEAARHRLVVRGSAMYLMPVGEAAAREGATAVVIPLKGTVASRDGATGSGSGARGDVGSGSGSGSRGDTTAPFGTAGSSATAPPPAASPTVPAEPFQLPEWGRVRADGRDFRVFDVPGNGDCLPLAYLDGLRRQHPGSALGGQDVRGLREYIADWFESDQGEEMRRFIDGSPDAPASPVDVLLGDLAGDRQALLEVLGQDTPPALDRAQLDAVDRALEDTMYRAELERLLTSDADRQQLRNLPRSAVRELLPGFRPDLAQAPSAERSRLVTQQQLIAVQTEIRARLSLPAGDPAGDAVWQQLLDRNAGLRGVLGGLHRTDVARLRPSELVARSIRDRGLWTTPFYDHAPIIAARALGLDVVLVEDPLGIGGITRRLDHTATGPVLYLFYNGSNHYMSMAPVGDALPATGTPSAVDAADLPAESAPPATGAADLPAVPAGTAADAAPAASPHPYLARLLRAHGASERAVAELGALSQAGTNALLTARREGLENMEPAPDKTPATSPAPDKTPDKTPATSPAPDKTPAPAPATSPAPPPAAPRLRPARIEHDLDDRRPPRIDRDLPPAALLGGRPVRFTDQARLPAYMGAVGSLLKNLRPDVLRRSFSFGQSDRVLRGADLVVAELDSLLADRPGVRPAAPKKRGSKRTGLLDAVNRRIDQAPHSFFGDGRRFVYRTADGKKRVLTVTARPYGSWERFTTGYANPTKNDTMARKVQGFGRSASYATNTTLLPSVPLGPAKAPITGWGRVFARFSWNKRVQYTMQNQVLSQTETRTWDGSHGHLDHVWYDFTVTDTSGRPVDASGKTIPAGDTVREPVAFGFAVRDGLYLRLADSVAKQQPSEVRDELPRSMTIGRGAHYRTVVTEGYGPMSHARDWALQQAKVTEDSVAGTQLSDFFSTDGFHRMGRMLNAGPVTTPPLFRDEAGLEPIGVFSVEVTSGDAILIDATKAVELRDISQSLVRNERVVGKSAAQEVGGSAGPALQFFKLEGLFDIRLLAGLNLRFGASRGRTTATGGTGARKIAGTSKDKTTGYYLVEKTVTITAPPAEKAALPETPEGQPGKLRKNPPDQWSAPPPSRSFQTWSIERLTRTEARRLAGLDTGARPGPEPAVPPYLTEDHPVTLGMSRVEEFTFADGAHTKTIAGRDRTFLQYIADQAIEKIGKAYPGLVVPLDQLNPEDPRWRSPSHFQTVLNNTLEVLNTLSHHHMATNPDPLLGTGLPITLTDPGRILRGTRHVVVQIDLTGRRFEGTQDDQRLRFSSVGSENLGGRQSGTRGTDVGVEGLLSTRDAATDEIGMPKNAGTASVGWRWGRRKATSSTYGPSATYEPMAVSNAGSHLYSYQVVVTARRSGFWRFRSLLRGPLLLNLLGTRPFVFAEDETWLIAPPAPDEAGYDTGPADGSATDTDTGIRSESGPVSESPSVGSAVGRVLISVPAEHAPTLTPARPPHGLRGIALALTRRASRDLALGTRALLERAARRTPAEYQRYPHQTLVVVADPTLAQATEDVLAEASHGAWQLTRKGAAPHDAALRVFQSQYLSANFDQTSAPTGYRSSSLWVKGPYLNRSSVLAHRTRILPGTMAALTRGVTQYGENTLGGVTQAVGQSSRTHTVFFGGQLVYLHSHEGGVGNVGSYGLAISPYRRERTRQLVVSRVAIAEINRKDWGRQVLVVGDVEHEIAAASSELGLPAAKRDWIPGRLADAAGRRVVNPDGWVGHIPEKYAYRLGLLTDGFGDVPLYKGKLWSPQPWLLDHPFGSWPANGLNTAPVLADFDGRLRRYGLSEAARDTVMRLVSDRVTRALGKEMTGAQLSTPAGIGRWGSQTAQVWLGNRQVRVRAELIPVKVPRGTDPAGTGFGGLGHSADLEEHRHAVETVQDGGGLVSGATLGTTLAQGAHTTEDTLRAAGPTWAETGGTQQTATHDAVDGSVRIATAATTQAHAEYTTRYQLRLTADITDGVTSDETPSPAALSGRRWWKDWTRRKKRSIVSEGSVGELTEHYPLSLMRPDPTGDEDGSQDGAQDDPLAPPQLEAPGEPRPVPVPPALGAGGWHDVPHPGEGTTKPFVMPEGFKPRRVVGMDHLRAANTLAMAAAYDTGFPRTGGLDEALLADARDTRLTGQGTGAAQNLEDGTTNGALTAFYDRTLTDGGYEIPGLTDRGFFGGADGDLRLYSKPHFGGAQLLTVTDGVKHESPKRDAQGGGMSVDHVGTTEMSLGAGPTASTASTGTSQMGASGPGDYSAESDALAATGDGLTSINVKPAFRTTRSFLFAVPTTWLSVASVRHHVKDSAPGRIVRSVFGNPQRPPQALETDTTVLAWVREDVARRLGLIDDANFPDRVAKAWDAVTKADQAWTAADKKYWDLRRDEGPGHEERLAAAEQALATLTARDPQTLPAVVAARAEIARLDDEASTAEPDHDGWAGLRDAETEAAREGLAQLLAAAGAEVTAAREARDAARDALAEFTARLREQRTHAEDLADEYARVRTATDRLTRWHQLSATEEGRTRLGDTPEPAEVTFDPPAAPETSPVPAAPTAATAAPAASVTSTAAPTEVRAASPAPAQPTTADTAQGAAAKVTGPVAGAAPTAAPEKGEPAGSATVKSRPEEDSSAPAQRPAHTRPPWQPTEDQDQDQGTTRFDAASDHRTLTATDPDGRAHVYDLEEPSGDGNLFYAAVERARGRRAEGADSLASLVAWSTRLPAGAALDPEAVFHPDELRLRLGPGFRRDTELQHEIAANGGRLPDALHAGLTPEQRESLLRLTLLKSRQWDAGTAALAATLTAQSLGVDLTVVAEDGSYRHYSGTGPDATGPREHLTVHQRGGSFLAARPRGAGAPAPGSQTGPVPPPAPGASETTPPSRRTPLETIPEEDEPQDSEPTPASEQSAGPSAAPAQDTVVIVADNAGQADTYGLDPLVLTFGPDATEPSPRSLRELFAYAERLALVVGGHYNEHGETGGDPIALSVVGAETAPGRAGERSVAERRVARVHETVRAYLDNLFSGDPRDDDYVPLEEALTLTSHIVPPAGPQPARTGTATATDPTVTPDAPYRDSAESVASESSGQGKAAVREAAPDLPGEDPSATAADIEVARAEYAAAFEGYAGAAFAVQRLQERAKEGAEGSDRASVLATAVERLERTSERLQAVEAKLRGLGADPAHPNPDAIVPVVSRTMDQRAWVAEQLTPEDLPGDLSGLDLDGAPQPASVLSGGRPAPEDQVRLLMVRPGPWPAEFEEAAANVARRVWREAFEDFAATVPDDASGDRARELWGTATVMVLPLELHPVLADSRYATAPFRDAVRQVAQVLAADDTSSMPTDDTGEPVDDTRGRAAAVAARLRRDLGLRPRLRGGAPSAADGAADSVEKRLARGLDGWFQEQGLVPGEEPGRRREEEEAALGTGAGVRSPGAEPGVGADGVWVHWLGDVNESARQTAVDTVAAEGSTEFIVVALQPNELGLPVRDGVVVSPEEVTRELLAPVPAGVVWSGPVRWVGVGGMVDRDFVERVTRLLWRAGAPVAVLYDDAQVQRTVPDQMSALPPAPVQPEFGAWLGSWLEGMMPPLSQEDLVTLVEGLDAVALGGILSGAGHVDPQVGARITRVVERWEYEARLPAAERQLGAVRPYPDRTQKADGGTYHLGAWLKGQMRSIDPKLTQGDVARRAGIKGKNSINGYVSGALYPNDRFLRGLLDALSALKYEARLTAKAQEAKARRWGLPPYPLPTHKDDKGDFRFGAWLDERLRELRRKESELLTEITTRARRTKTVSRATLSRIHRGKSYPDDQDLDDILDGLSALRRDAQSAQEAGLPGYGKDDKGTYVYGVWLREQLRTIDPKLTMEDLARRLRMEPARLRPIFDGQKEASEEIRKRIAKALEVLKSAAEPEGAEAYAAWLRARMEKAGVSERALARETGLLIEPEVREILDAAYDPGPEARQSLAKALRIFERAARLTAKAQQSGVTLYLGPEGAAAYADWLDSQLDEFTPRLQEKELAAKAHELDLDYGLRTNDVGVLLKAETNPDILVRQSIWEALWELKRTRPDGAKAADGTLDLGPEKGGDNGNRAYAKWLRAWQDRFTPRLTHAALSAKIAKLTPQAKVSESLVRGLAAGAWWPTPSTREAVGKALWALAREAESEAAAPGSHGGAESSGVAAVEHTDAMDVDSPQPTVPVDPSRSGGLGVLETEMSGIADLDAVEADAMEVDPGVSDVEVYEGGDQSVLLEEEYGSFLSADAAFPYGDFDLPPFPSGAFDFPPMTEEELAAQLQADVDAFEDPRTYLDLYRGGSAGQGGEGGDASMTDADPPRGRLGGLRGAGPDSGAGSSSGGGAGTGPSSVGLAGLAGLKGKGGGVVWEGLGAGRQSQFNHDLDVALRRLSGGRLSRLSFDASLVEEVYEELPSYWGLLGSGGLSSHEAAGPLRVQAGRVAEILLSIVEQGRLPGSLAGLKGGAPGTPASSALAGGFQEQYPASEAGPSRASEGASEGGAQVDVAGAGDRGVAVHWLGEVDESGQWAVVDAVFAEGSGDFVVVGLRPNEEGLPERGGSAVSAEEVAQQLLRSVPADTWRRAAVRWVAVGGWVDRGFVEQVTRLLWRAGAPVYVVYDDAEVQQAVPGQKSMLPPNPVQPEFGAWLGRVLEKMDPPLSREDVVFMVGRLDEAALGGILSGSGDLDPQVAERIVRVVRGWEREAHSSAVTEYPGWWEKETRKDKKGNDKEVYKFGAWLSAERKKVVPEPTRQRMAAEIGISTSAVQRLLAGDIYPQIDDLAKITGVVSAWKRKTRLVMEARQVKVAGHPESWEVEDKGHGIYLYKFGAWVTAQIREIDPKLTLATVSDKAGVSRSNFNTIARGGRYPSDQDLPKILAALSALRSEVQAELEALGLSQQRDLSDGAWLQGQMKEMEKIYPGLSLSHLSRKSKVDSDTLHRVLGGRVTKREVRNKLGRALRELRSEAPVVAAHRALGPEEARAYATGLADWMARTALSPEDLAGRVQGLTASDVRHLLTATNDPGPTKRASIVKALRSVEREARFAELERETGVPIDLGPEEDEYPGWLSTAISRIPGLTPTTLANKSNSLDDAYKMNGTYVGQLLSGKFMPGLLVRQSVAETLRVLELEAGLAPTGRRDAESSTGAGAVVEGPSSTGTGALESTGPVPEDEGDESGQYLVDPGAEGAAGPVPTGEGSVDVDPGASGVEVPEEAGPPVLLEEEYSDFPSANATFPYGGFDPRPFPPGVFDFSPLPGEELEFGALDIPENPADFGADGPDDRDTGVDEPEPEPFSEASVEPDAEQIAQWEAAMERLGAPSPSGDEFWLGEGGEGGDEPMADGESSGVWFGGVRGAGGAGSVGRGLMVPPWGSGPGEGSGADVGSSAGPVGGGLSSFDFQVVRAAALKELREKWKFEGPVDDALVGRMHDLLPGVWKRRQTNEARGARVALMIVARGRRIEYPSIDVDPYAEGWPVGGVVAVEEPRRVGRGPIWVVRDGVRPAGEDVRVGLGGDAYVVRRDGSVVLEGGEVLSAEGWVKHGYDFIHRPSGALLRGDSGWVGFAADKAGLERRLVAMGSVSVSEFRLVPGKSGLYFVPDGGVTKVGAASVGVAAYIPGPGPQPLSGPEPDFSAAAGYRPEMPVGETMGAGLQGGAPARGGDGERPALDGPSGASSALAGGFQEQYPASEAGPSRASEGASEGGPQVDVAGAGDRGVAVHWLGEVDESGQWAVVDAVFAEGSGDFVVVGLRPNEEGLPERGGSAVSAEEVAQQLLRSVPADTWRRAAVRWVAVGGWVDRGFVERVTRLLWRAGAPVYVVYDDAEVQRAVPGQKSMLPPNPVQPEFGAWLGRVLEKMDPPLSHEDVVFMVGRLDMASLVGILSGSGDLDPQVAERIVRVVRGWEREAHSSAVTEYPGWWEKETRKDRKGNDKEVYKFGAWLNAERKKILPKLTHEKLAEAAGITTNSLSRIMLGRTYPAAEDLVGLLGVLSAWQRKARLAAEAQQAALTAYPKSWEKQDKGNGDFRYAFGAWLAAQIEEIDPKLTRAKVADRVKMAPHSFGNIVRGEVYPSDQDLPKILEALSALRREYRAEAEALGLPQESNDFSYQAWLDDQVEQLKKIYPGLNLRLLARKAKMDSGAVTRFLKGQRDAKDDSRKKIARALQELRSEAPLVAAHRDLGPEMAQAYATGLAAWLAGTALSAEDLADRGKGVSLSDVNDLLAATRDPGLKVRTAILKGMWAVEREARIAVLEQELGAPLELGPDDAKEYGDWLAKEMRRFSWLTPAKLAGRSNYLDPEYKLSGNYVKHLQEGGTEPGLVVRQAVAETLGVLELEARSSAAPTSAGQGAAEPPSGADAVVEDPENLPDAVGPEASDGGLTSPLGAGAPAFEDPMELDAVDAGAEVPERTDESVPPEQAYGDFFSPDLALPHGDFDPFPLEAFEFPPMTEEDERELFSYFENPSLQEELTGEGGEGGDASMTDGGSSGWFGGALGGSADSGVDPFGVGWPVGRGVV